MRSRFRTLRAAVGVTSEWPVVQHSKIGRRKIEWVNHAKVLMQFQLLNVSRSKCVRVSLESIDGGRDVRYSPDSRGNCLEAEDTGRCLIFAQLLCNHRIANVSHDRHATQPGNKLAQQIESLAGKISG